ncbi:MAG: BatA domain-containing protein [Planctomycetota bacterium]
MFLYPALIAGFAFVAIPLLVHLINMLRHRKRPWAAMDFLLLSFRKRQKWLRLRQFLLLLSRLVLAVLLAALLCGWTGGRQLLRSLGGQTTHHIVILDDSYSMGDQSGGDASAYARALQSLEQLVQRLASGDGEHQLTVMRASRAALALRGGNESGDAAADLSAQTIMNDAGIVARVMATEASPIRTDLIPALELASELANATDADELEVYIASDFRQRDWASAERLSEAMSGLSDGDARVRMIDCAERPQANLGVTELTPIQDVWVAGVPVVVRATIKNFGQSDAKNVTLACRVIRYGDSIATVDPTQRLSGKIESLPGLVIDRLAAGEEITKTFQVFINERGTHAIEVQLPPDALSIDNTRVCTLPLSDVERVLVIDSDPDQAGAYTVAAVLNPGSQVRVGAIPDIKPPGFLRSATAETLAGYRAVYLIDLPDVTDSAATALSQYVRDGGGLAWFLGPSVVRERYNTNLLAQGRQLLPAPLEKIVDLTVGSARDTGDVLFGDEDTLIDPLRSGGDSSLATIGIAKSWSFEATDFDGPSNETGPEATRYGIVFQRRDQLPLVTEHAVGSGTVVTVLTGLGTDWTNWPGDLTFVPFMLLSNARLWSGAAAATSRKISDPLSKTILLDEYFPELKLIPPSDAPRVAVETTATESTSVPNVASLELDPIEQLIAGNSNVDDLLRPGLTEWGLLKADGGSVVLPSAAVIENGEGDLRRASPAEITRSLLPLEVQFVTSEAWSQQSSLAGSSTIGLMLLALLGLVLAAEQGLAYWASYHTSSAPSGPSERTLNRPAFGLKHDGGQSG